MEPEEKKKKKRKITWARLRPLLQDSFALLWRVRGRLLLAFPLLLLNRAASIVIPGTTKYLIDDVIGKQNYELLWTLTMVAAAVTIVDAISGFALAQLLGIAAQRSITDMRRRIQQHLQRLPIRYFDSAKTGSLVSRVMYDAEGIRNLVGTGLVQIVASSITAAVALGILIYLSAKLTMFISFALIAFAVILVWAFTTMRPLFRKRGEINAQIYGRLSETLSGIRVVKAYRGERREALVFTKGIHDFFRNIVKTMRMNAAVGAMSSLLIGLVSVTIMIVGGREVLAGRMTTGGLISYILYLGALVAPVAIMVSIGTQLAEAFAGLERIRETFAEFREDEGDRGRKKLEHVEGTVEFRDVSFEYTTGTPVLRDISFTAPAGTSTALVGPSGSGKSTLIALVARFYKPTSGEIYLDREPMSEIRLSDYRAQIGIVPQDAFLFSGTIYENIVFGSPNAPRDEVLRAAKIAHVDEFAEKYADRYETVVGERGVKLSGGQKQRVAIARAILADPRILILDEATSSLDSESEALIQDGLNELMKGRTTFVIAHRLSTVRSATQILVLEGGQIVERGSHAQLLSLSGRYRQLYERQYGVEMNRFINPGEEVPDLDDPNAEIAPVDDARLRS